MATAGSSPSARPRARPRPGASPSRRGSPCLPRPRKPWSPPPARMDKVDPLDAAFFSKRSDEKKTRKKAPVGRRQFAEAVREAQEGEAAAGDYDRSGRRRRSLHRVLDEVHSSGDHLLAAQT